MTFLSLKRRSNFSSTLVIITLLISILTAALFIRVGNLGVQIRHSEIRASNSNNTNISSEYSNLEEDEHEDEDHED